MNIKLTFDGFGLNDANDEYRKRVLTFADKNTPKEVGEYIEQAVNQHEALVKIAQAYRNLLRTMAQTEGEVATFQHIENVLKGK